MGVDVSSGNPVTGSLLNFRDFGWVATIDGGRVAADLLFRSGHHARLLPAARDGVLAYDFALIIDLRYPDERSKDASPWPTDWANRILTHSAESGTEAPHIALLAAASDGEEAVHSAYRRLYAQMPFDPVHRPLFAHALTRIASAQGRVLVHCSAGKDRTGMFVALLLDLLGVARGDIARDYLLSARSPALLAVRDEFIVTLRNEGNAAPEAMASALIGVRADYLDAMFSAVDERDGASAAYFAASAVPAEAITQVMVRMRTLLDSRTVAAAP